MSVKERDIRRLIDLTNKEDVKKLGAESADLIIIRMKKATPQIPERFWDEFKKEIHPERVVDLLVTVYDKHLDHEDIKAAIAFYESPSGRKYVAAEPLIAEECVTIGKKWAEELAKRAADKLQAEMEAGK